MLHAHVSRRLWVHLQPCIVRTVKKLPFVLWRDAIGVSFLPTPKKDPTKISVLFQRRLHAALWGSMLAWQWDWEPLGVPGTLNSAV